MTIAAYWLAPAAVAGLAMGWYLRSLVAGATHVEDQRELREAFEREQREP